MASKFHKNAIMTGQINSFCLACEYFLRSEEDATQHIAKPLHQKQLAMIPYFEKFKTDHIRKVKMGYYCEFCNVLMPIASRVTLHIADDAHIHNKGVLLLKLKGSDVIAFDNVVIKGTSWHGIIENVCVLCNVEFDDERVHKSTEGHVLKLVQTPVKFGANNAIYRQVDDSTVQCFTCEIVIASNTMTSHFNDSKHLSLYIKCKLENDMNQVRDLKSGKPTETIPIKLDLTADNKTKNNEDKTIQDTSCNNQDMNRLNIKLADSVSDADKSELTKDTSPNDDEVTNTQKSPLKSELVAFATANNITYNEKNSKAYCRICEKRFSSTLLNMKEHVAGAAHIKKVESDKKRAKLNIPMEPMRRFVNESLTVEWSILGGLLVGKDVVVNEKYCMAYVSFLMITKVGEAWRCQACEVNLTSYDEDGTLHAQMCSHERAMKETRVVTSDRTEFIRQVRTGVFHCGYCNQVTGSWDDTNNHLQCSEHAKAKSFVQRRLQTHLPGLRQYKLEKGLNRKGRNLFC